MCEDSACGSSLLDVLNTCVDIVVVVCVTDHDVVFASES